jgi:hypothetical protein
MVNKLGIERITQVEKPVFFIALATFNKVAILVKWNFKQTRSTELLIGKKNRKSRQ